MRTPVLVLVTALCVSALERPAYRIQTVAGSDYVGDEGPALSALLSIVEGVAADPVGNLYLADANDHRVRKIAGGLISTLAGTGHAGLRGDGGPAAGAQINNPYGLAADSAGNVYIADLLNARVRRVTADGRINTVAGGGVSEVKEGGRALELRLTAPRNVAVDVSGNLYVSDFDAHRVYKITPSGAVFTLAGTGSAGFSGDGKPATSAQLAFPAGIAIDANGAVYIADSGNKRVRRVLSGTIATVLGQGIPRTGNYRALVLQNPTGLAVDANGNLYVADAARIVKLTPGGIVSTILVPARDVALGGKGNLYAASGGQVRVIDPSGNVRLIAGNGQFTSYGDGAPATSARLYRPFGIALGADGSLLFTDQGNHRVRKVAASGVLTTIAGTGEQGYRGDGGSAETARLNAPSGLSVGPAGAILISDSGNHRVRSLHEAGGIRTVAGTGTPGAGSTSSAGTATQLATPEGVASANGSVYIADRDNHCVRKLGPDGILSIIAGTGSAGFSGDGGPAIDAGLSSPRGVAVDREGNVYIADAGNHRIRRVGLDGTIETIAGTGERGFAGDGGPAELASIDSPLALAFEPINGDLLVSDAGNHRIRRITTEGVIDTIAGTGAPGFSGDEGAAVFAQLNLPAGLVADDAGTIYICDFLNDRVRKLTSQTGSLPPEPVPQDAVLNAASLLAGAVSPGEIVAIFGAGLGPAAGLSGTLDESGRLLGELGGTRVFFDGRPAPLFYVQAGQVNVQVPYAVAGRSSTDIEVLYGNSTAARFQVPVADAAPGIFTLENGKGQAAAINQDGTQNSESSPAPRGSVVTFFLTGEGETTPAGVEGRPAAKPLPRPLAPEQVTIGPYIADVEYAGAAPGYSGLMQINARVPAGFAPSGILPLTVRVGSVETQSGVTIAVK